MKTKNTISIFLILITGFTFAQKIEYVYSPSGNRTMRKFNVSAFRVGKKDSTQSVNDFAKIVMQEGISVFPNPASDKIVLTISEFDPEETTTMSLVDTKGTEILARRVTQKNSEMDISFLSSGVYYFKVVKDKDVLYYKIVKI